MNWRACKSVLGYWQVVLLADDGFELGAASVNQFGRPRCFWKKHPSRLGDWSPHWTAFDTAAKRAREICAPVSGRFGYRSSSKREEICAAIAAALNEAGVFPAKVAA